MDTEIQTLTGGRLRTYHRLSLIESVLSRFNPFIRWTSIFGMVILVLMMGFIFVSVVMRYVFNRPLLGQVELIEIMMAVVVFSAIAYAQLTKSHVTMDIVVNRLSARPRLILEGSANLISIALFCLIVYCSILNTLNTVSTTPIFAIPLRYMRLLVPFGSILLTIMLLRDFIINMKDSLTYKENIWIFMLGIPALVICAVFWFLIFIPISLSLTALGLAGIIFMLVMLAAGMPIGYVLMGVGVVMLIYARGSIAGFDILGKTWYETVASYNWSPIMFFMLMGFFCFHAGFGRDMFHAATRFLGHFHGGLAMGTVAACTAFGAVVGDNLSGTITMTAIGYPEMKRYKYDEKLTIGALTCSGTIGALIPPSVSLIMYGVLAEVSIGKLFMAGIIPGIVCALSFMATIYIRCRIDPSLGPPALHSTWKERMSSLKSGGPIIALFLLVIGGIYTGAFTATEGGGIGAFGALVLALAMRRMNWKSFGDSIVETAKFVAMAFTVLGGAMVFGYFIVVSKLPLTLASYIATLNVSSTVIMIFIVVTYFFLGCFLPVLPLLLITVPIFLPIAVNLGWDLIWFGIIISLMMNMAAITPPFGIQLFVMKGLTNRPLSLIFASVVPFIIALFVTVLLIIAFPELATWLPYLFYL